jgi:hypothetical protein
VISDQDYFSSTFALFAAFAVKHFWPNADG